MSKRFLNWLILTIRTVALIPGKVNFTRLSRYGGRTAKTFASNFKTSVDWIMAIGAISLSKDTCVMLGAVQSPNFRTLEAEKKMSMLDWYVSLVRSKATDLLSLTDILVADAFFPDTNL